MQDMSLELEVLKSQEPEHHFFPAASEMLLDPLNWRHFFHMNCDGKVLCVVSEPDSDPTVMERSEWKAAWSLAAFLIKMQQNIF